MSADEAMQVLESRDDISLLFTDIQMPGSMDGLKLAHAVRRRWPHIKIILVSGRSRSRTPTNLPTAGSSRSRSKSTGWFSSSRT
ncbi:MAG: response regulator [Sphingomonas sp.]